MVRASMIRIDSREVDTLEAYHAGPSIHSNSQYANVLVLVLSIGTCALLRYADGQDSNINKPRRP